MPEGTHFTDTERAYYDCSMFVFSDYAITPHEIVFALSPDPIGFLTARGFTWLTENQIQSGDIVLFGITSKGFPENFFPLHISYYYPINREKPFLGQVGTNGSPIQFNSFDELAQAYGKRILCFRPPEKSGPQK